MEPTVTFPKLKLVALAASVPDDDPDFVPAAGVPAPVSAKQPDRDNAAIKARQIVLKPLGEARFGPNWRCARKFEWILMQGTV